MTGDDILSGFDLVSETDLCVMADWLTDNGRDGEAELVRLRVPFARLSGRVVRIESVRVVTRFTTEKSFDDDRRWRRTVVTVNGSVVFDSGAVPYFDSYYNSHLSQWDFPDVCVPDPTAGLYANDGPAEYFRERGILYTHDADRVGHESHL